MSEKVAVYARYSTDRQDARSIDDQVRRCREFAKVRGYAAVASYADSAISGSHTQRPELQALLEAANGRRFTAVLVDDLSRLSRDLGNTWRIVFEDLASLGVRVIDCTTGMASDGAGARLTFGAMALVNDTFLQLVKAETHRGLEGRAIGGFWTGGRVFGYSTVTEPNPPDPEHPRKVPVIDETEAAVVRRIFDMSAEGVGFASIADQLNRGGIKAPYDRGEYTKKGGRGWAAGTVRNMLVNERYVGRFVWNKRKFVRSSGKKNRKAIARPASEWRVRDVPELAIVTTDQWARVQKRIQKRRARPFGASAKANTPHLLSGITKCGVCGVGIGVIGQRTKNGVRYVTFGCRAHYSRGGAICANGMTISEKKLNDLIFDDLRARLLSPGAIKEFVEAFNVEMAALAKTPQTSAVDQEIGAAEKKVANLTDALGKVGFSEALGNALRAEEERLRLLKARRKETSSSAARVRMLPTAKAVEKYLTNLFASLKADPAKARALLAEHFADSPPVLTPKNDGPGHRSYVVTGAFNLWTPEVLGKSLCGGAQAPFPETWIPLEAQLRQCVERPAASTR